MPLTGPPQEPGGSQTLHGHAAEDEDLEQLNRGCCPDCNSHFFHPGPRGGEARNVKCANCGEKFWYGPPFSPKRIDNDDQVYDLDRRVQLKDLKPGIR